MTKEQTLLTASLLLSDEGENVEYDRAIVELTSDLLGISLDDRDETLALLHETRKQFWTAR